MLDIKNITIIYFASLREERGLDQEEAGTDTKTAEELYLYLKKQHNFSLSIDSLKVAINEEFKSWNTILQNGDVVAFIPPVAGG